MAKRGFLIDGDGDTKIRVLILKIETARSDLGQWVCNVDYKELDGGRQRRWVGEGSTPHEAFKPFEEMLARNNVGRAEPT